MATYRFRRGMHVEFRGREYVVEERLPNDDLRLRDLALNESKPVPESELINALFEGDFEFLGDSSVTLAQRKIFRAFVDDFNMLEDDDKRKIEAKRRYAYVKALDEIATLGFSREKVEPLVKRVHQEIEDPKRKPHWKTVCYGWHVQWLVSGKDLRALIPHYEECGNTEPRFCATRKREGEEFSEDERQRAKEVKKIVNDVIQEHYLNPQCLTPADVHEKLDLRIADENRFRYPDDQLPIPHRSSVYEIISKLDEYEVDAARYGTAYADRMHKSNKQVAHLTRPLQKVEIDDTKLDLFVVDPETRLPVGRPTITYAIDGYSRMPLGLHVGFDGPGYLAVMQCLLHAITPKSYLRDHFPDVENDWPAYGIPEELVVDNGPAYISEDLSDACLQIGTVLTQCRVKHPEDKPMVERSFKRYNQQLLHKQPGTTFSNIVDKGEYDPEKNAIISFDALMEIIHLWLVDVYARSLHRGHDGIPVAVWEEGVKHYPPALPRRREEIRILLGHVERRVVGPSGIELFTLHYNCTELASLRGESVKVKYDPKDISLIYVYNPKSDRYITTPALDQKYAKGLSLWQHDVIKAYVRNVMREQLNPDALRRAKKKIQEIVDEEWLKSGASGTRIRMARWRGIRQPDYNATLERPAGHDTQRQLPPMMNPPMLRPGATTNEGISDLPHALGRQQDDGQPEQNGQPSFITMKVGAANGSKNGHRKPSAKPPGEKEAEMAQDAVTDDASDEAGASSSQDFDELEVPGFSGSYDLPMKED